MKKKSLLEKLIKVITAEENLVSTVCLNYKVSDPIDMSLPTLRAVIDRKIYLKSNLKPTISGSIEHDVFIELIDAAGKWGGTKEYIPLLDSNCDQEIYAATKRVRANVVVCNKKTKKLAKKTNGKKVLISEYIPDNTLLLMSVPEDGYSYAAILVKDKEEKNYLLDIINPELIKVINIDEVIE